ncbi:MAG TPA: hypothetical protein VF106_00410 [Actinophytocola sp.]
MVEQAKKAKEAASAPGNPLGQSVQKLVGVATKRLATTVTGKVGQLTAFATNGGKSAASKAQGEADQDDSGDDSNGNGKGEGKGEGGDRFKVTSLIEQIDVGAPAGQVYDEWARFEDFPDLWSHRSSESTLVEEVPHERMVWMSERDSEHIDAAVTFHELAPDLTRVVLVLEYHPKNIVERTGNLWRARAGRARHELKNFQRYVMTHAVLHSEEEEPPQQEKPRSRASRGTAATKTKPTTRQRSRA